MNLRVLSGVLITRDVSEGDAIISFRTNTLDAGTSPGVTLGRTEAVGDPMPATGFIGDPAYTVSIRELKVVETEWVAGRWHEGDEVELFQINTSDPSSTSLHINWRSRGGSRIEEISYMIIGAVSHD